MKAVIEGALGDASAKEVQDLIRWGYLTMDGNRPAPTEEGTKAFETWQNMDIEQ